MKRIYTIGHSTYPIDDFIEILHSYNITELVDIRTIPNSRHNPQFGQENLKKSLSKAQIRYEYLKELGGLRSSHKDSINTAWRNKSFRNYADYMQTDEFGHGIESLIKLSKNGTSCLMCAEAVPWRCHRSLVGDALLVRGIKVVDIMSKTNTREHTLTSFAKVDGKQITYPGE